MTDFHRTRRVVLLMLAVGCLNTDAWSGQTSHVISGVVKDTSGAVVTGADVTVTGSNGLLQRVVTDARGEFRLDGLPPGDYLVGVERARFARNVVAVQLTEAEPFADVRLTLNAAGLSEHVTIRGRSPYAPPEMTTAGKVPVARRQTPNSVSVLTRAQMDDQNMVNTWDALSQITGITAVSNDGTQSQFHARGAGLESQQDGMPSAMPFSGYQQYDLAIYERIEVLRGPAGVLQGAGAFSGVVNLVRKRPRRTFSASAWASTGQWRNHHVEADVSGPLTSSLRGRAVLAATDRDFFYERGHDRKWLGYGALEWERNNTVVGFTVAHQKDRTPGFSGLPAYTDGTVLNVKRSFNPFPSWNRYTWDTTDVGLDIERQLTASWRVVAKINRRTQGLLFHDSYPTEGVSRETFTTSFARRESESEYTANNADGYVDGRFSVLGREQHWLAGFNVTRFDSRGRGVNPNDDPSLIVRGVRLDDPPEVPEPTFTYRSGSHNRTQQSGLYTLLRSKLSQRITTVLGGRWTNYEAQSRRVAPSTPTDWTPGAEASRQFTPYGGAVLDVTRGVSLYASYSEIFVPQTSRRVDGGVLDPRIGHQWEIGAKGEHMNARLLTALAAFDVRDRNRAYPDPVNTGFFVPLGEVESRGVEAEVVGRATAQWDVSAGYTWLETKYLVHQFFAGEPLSYWYPKHSVKAWSTFRVSRGMLDGLKIGAGVQAYSHSASGTDAFNTAGVLTVAARRQRGYAIVLANLSYELPRNLQVIVQMNNLFDRTYYTRLGGTNTYNTFGDPRNVVVSLRWRF